MGVQCKVSPRLTKGIFRAWFVFVIWGYALQPCFAEIGAQSVELGSYHRLNSHEHKSNGYENDEHVSAPMRAEDDQKDENDEDDSKYSHSLSLIEHGDEKETEIEQPMEPEDPQPAQRQQRPNRSCSVEPVWNVAGPGMIALTLGQIFQEIQAAYKVRRCDSPRDVYGKSAGIPVSHRILFYGDTHISNFYPNELFWEPMLRHARQYWKPEIQFLLGDAMNSVGGAAGGGPIPNVSDRMFRVLIKRLIRAIGCTPNPQSQDCPASLGNHDIKDNITKRFEEEGFLPGNQFLCLGPVPSILINTQAPESLTGNVLFSMEHIPYTFDSFRIPTYKPKHRARIHVGAHVHVQGEQTNGTEESILVSATDPYLAWRQEIENGCSGISNCRFGTGFDIFDVHSQVPSLTQNNSSPSHSLAHSSGWPSHNYSINCPGAENIAAISHRVCMTDHYPLSGYAVATTAMLGYAYRTGGLKRLIKSSLATVAVTGLWMLYNFFPPQSWSDLASN